MSQEIIKELRRQLKVYYLDIVRWENMDYDKTKMEMDNALSHFDNLALDAEKWRAHIKSEASKLQACSVWAEDKTFWDDATRYRKIKAISQKHGGIDICESPGMVDVFHTGLDAGHKAPTFDQAIDEVVE